MLRSLHAWTLLIRRSFHVFVADRVNATWAFLQVPLIIGLTLLAFAGVEQDERSLDYFVRFVTHGQAYISERDAERESVVLSKFTAREIHAAAQADDWHVSAATGQRRASIYFLLVSSAIWFGIMGSCREVVGERHVLMRETRSCFGIAPFLGAKLVVQAVISAIQTGLLGLCVAFVLLDAQWTSALLLWFVLWASALAAIGLGLLLSSLSPNIRVALTLVPLLMIPQFLLGGLLRGRPSAAEPNPPPSVDGSPQVVVPSEWDSWREVVCGFVMQRWGFEAALATDPVYATNGVLALQFCWPDIASDRRWSADELFQTIRTREASLVGQLFGTDAHHRLLNRGFMFDGETFVSLTWRRIWFPIFVLLSMTMGCVVVAYVIMRFRFL